VTFIIRITRDSARRVSGTRITRGVARRVSGTVERVRTGEKERFTDTAGVGLVIERMLESDHQTKRRRRRTQEEEP
jgi:hypothetical protein